ncbi:MarR family transcriptional regulator [Brevibacillus daliensis]|uniref:MarR family transcriptional regulator n=1 Tax=Brevibacillus daliensis TaxID=2892995 RepID=UPI001E4F20A6|nr:MarR family transcriptional regulator [Brevibacillus daliensis]
MLILFLTVIFFGILKFLQPYSTELVGQEPTLVAIIVVSSGLAFLIGLPLQFKKVIRRYDELTEYEFPSRNEDSAILEVLSIASSQKGYVSIIDVAAQSEMTIERAQNILNKLQKSGYADLSVAETGDVIYYFVGFEEWEEE